MNDIALIAAGGVAAAGLVAYVAHLVGDSKRRKKGRPMLRSIPEALAKAHRGRRRVLVAFVRPGEKPSDELLAVFDGPDLPSRLLAHFELVRIDAGRDDEDVVQHLAAKYGVAKLGFPSLLALSGEGEKLATLEGELSLEKVLGLLESSRPGG
ncbi:MAG TPA: hypothetical protein VFF73_41825 [Planctomycetota bacterium]|nr:hypothetical protein [Planctomycetota bacterium]